MARITLKQALEQLEALRHNAHLVEVERDSLRTENEHLRARVVTAAAGAASRASTYVRRGPSAEQQAAHDAYLTALAAARDLAMRTGRAVKVG